VALNATSTTGSSPWTSSGLGKITFRDYRPVLDGFAAIPNVVAFRKQVDAFVALVAGAPPSTEQQDDVDFSLTIGQLFSLLVYAGVVLEAVPAWGVADELLNEIFGVFVRDFNGYATDLLGKASTTTEQADLARGVPRASRPSTRRGPAASGTSTYSSTRTPTR
jgi:acyl-CoA dehydrogenase